MTLVNDETGDRMHPSARTWIGVSAQEGLSLCALNKSREIGDNSGRAIVRVETRLFNSLAKYGGEQGLLSPLRLLAGATVGDVVDLIVCPFRNFLVL